MTERITTLPPIAILASGNGTTAEAYIRAWQEERVEPPVGLVICNRPPEEAGVYERVARLNEYYGLEIPVEHIGPQTHPCGPAERGQTDEESETIAQLCREEGIGLVALMGYLRIVRGDLLVEYGWHDGMSKYQGRILNSHPGPLPETRDTIGVRASEIALILGMKASKHTVHLVSAGVDSGPIIAEHEVPVEPGDSPQKLFARVQSAEKLSLPYVIELFMRRQRELRQM